MTNCAFINQLAQSFNNLFRNCVHKLVMISLTLVALNSAGVHAQEPKKDITFSELSWMDNNHMVKQRELIDDIARLQLGTQLQGNKKDLETLQRIVYRSLIKKDERIKLQALGVVLGDIFVHELGLQWTIFEDKFGRSRAVCIPNSENCLFPITMLSRRMEVGLLPDVSKVYEENAEAIAKLLPKNPYDASTHIRG